MGHSQVARAQTHERVLRVAARRVREDGLEHPGVSELMREAGLTHGGFYKHFASREDLIRQAAALALAKGTQQMAQAARTDEAEPLTGLIEAYLSRRHRDDPGTGCALVTLGSAAARGDNELRDAYEEQVRQYLGLITELVPAGQDQRAEAILVLSALVGGVLMARAVRDENLSDELLTTLFDKLIERR
jgi:TetR/AcrR family transcriptional repressor of nem operon